MAREPMTNVPDVLPPRRAAITRATMEGGDFDGRTFEVGRSLADIDMDDLRTEVSECGGNAVWWGILSAAAASMVRRRKLALDNLKSATATTKRLEHKRLGETFTIDSIKDEVAADARVQGAEEALIIAEEKAAVLRAVSMAVDQKQRTLGNLAGALAREMGVSESALRDRMRDRTPNRREVGQS